MSEQEKSDHWGFLLSDLGVESRPEEEAEPKVEPAPTVVEQTPAPRPKSTKQLPPPDVRRSPKDWLNLASQLGVEVPEEAWIPEPIPEPPQPQPVVEVPERRRPAAKSRWRVSDSEEPAGAVVEREPSKAKRWGEDIEAAEPAQEAEPTQETEVADKKRLRRRKRRRKIRRTEARVGGDLDLVEESETDDLVEIVETFKEESVDELSPAEVSEEDEAETISEEEPQKRSKRRRRRRSSRKKAKEEGAEGAEQGVRADDSATSEALDEEDVDTDDLEEDDDEGVGGREGHSRDKKALHRGIPSWKDAIDVVISANLEARAKRPDRGSGPRGRGGRNRGREKSEKNG